MRHLFKKLLASFVILIIFVLLVASFLEIGASPVLVLPLGAATLWLDNLIGKYLDKQKAVRDAEDNLLSDLSNLLLLQDEQRRDLGEFIALFSKTLCDTKAMTLNNVDACIDWIFQNGYFIPDFSQYKLIGMSIITKLRIYVPRSVRVQLGDEWMLLYDRAIRSGISLASMKSAPSIELWNAELASFVPWLFEASDNDSVSILSRIIQVAEEGRDEDMCFPEYISNLAGLPCKSEISIIAEVSDRIERRLREFAKEISVEAETSKTAPQFADIKNPEFRAGIAHLQRLGKRFDSVQEQRSHLLLTKELDELKSLARREAPYAK